MISQYKSLPKNWILTKIEDICTNPQYGYTTKASQGGNLKLLRTTDITSGRINWNKVPYCTKNPDDVGKYLLKNEDIVISRAGSVGVSYLIKDPEKAIFASYLIRFKPLINKRYFKYFLDSPFYWNSISEKKLGIAVPNVNANKLKSIIIPLSPLEEQNRIVQKIEELFSDLDKTTEDLKKPQEKLKIYRQAVLKAAFEGKLTEKCRQTRKEASNIKHTTLNNICIKAEKIKNEENSERKIKYLDIGSIDNKLFKIVSHKTYQIKNAPSRAKQIVKEGDTLFSTVRTYLKNIAYINSEYDNEICSTGFCVIRPKKDVLSSKYIFYYVISDDFVNRVSPLQTGTSYPAVRDDDIFKQIIPLVTIDEQEQIVNEIESRLSVCDKLEETVKQSLKKIEYLRQSILKKAFEGKLVSQDPNDLSTCELLKQIKIKKDRMSKNGK
jgi:type I restriction enzyme S subunit